MSTLVSFSGEIKLFYLILPVSGAMEVVERV